MEKARGGFARALRAAFPVTVPVLTGFLCLGVAYGILMSTSGLGIVWTGLMSAVAFGGSMQFVAISLLCGAFDPLQALLLSLMFTNGILKHLVERPRPWLTVEGLTPLIAEHDPNSFPSGHTSASFAAASAWCRTLPRRWMGVTAVVLAALMGFSRLYVGVHFPSDVLAGVLVGLFCSWLTCLLWRRFAAWRGLEA